MRVGAWLEACFKRFQSSSDDYASDWRYAAWRANYDEARAIARYFRCCPSGGVSSAQVALQDKVRNLRRHVAPV